MVRKKPAISVVMPAYNAERYIEQAIISILNQTLTNFELLIIDDASTDKTPSIIKKYQRKDARIKVIVNKTNLQIARSLNKLIKLARSEFVARMDADDVSFPRRLFLQYELIKKDKEIAVVGTDMVIIDKGGVPISKREYPDNDKKLKGAMFRYSPFAHPVVMFRKKVFEEFGGYDVNLVPCEDIDLWFKIGSKYKFASIPQPLIYYRIVPYSNSTKSLKDLELLGFKIKIDAIKKYGCKPSLYDVFYNIGQFLTLWFMPVNARVWMYNFLRSRKLI